MTTASKPPRAPRIEWPTAAALTAVLAALVAVWVVASPEQRATMLTGVGAIGSVGLAVMRAMLSAQNAAPPPVAPPPRSPNGIDKHDPLSRDSDRGALRVGAMLLALVCLPALGCGASALRTHATIATIAAGTLASTAPLVAPACDAALAGCDGAAACIDSTAERCRVAAVAAEGALVATRGYIDAIDVASLADEGLVLPALLSLASALAARWAEVVAALAGVGVTLPALDLGALLGGAS